MNNKLYDFLKTYVTITVPVSTAIYIVLASVRDMPYVVQTAVVMSIINAFLGIFLQINSKYWNNRDSNYDGKIVVTGNDGDTGLPDLQLVVTIDPNEFAKKRTIRLKSVDQR